jgi:tetratricopeptide (TPR) repeat protein
MKLVLSIFAIYILNAQTLPPSKSKVYKNLPEAHKLWIDGKLEASIAAFKKRKANAQNQYNIALLHSLLGQDATALKYVNEALRKNSSYADAYFLQGQIYTRRGFSDQAIKSFKRAIDEESEGIYHLSLAKLLKEQGKIEEAIEHFEEAADEEESLMEAQIEIAEYISKNDNKAAIEHLIESLENQYPSGRYYLLLGDLYQNEKNTKQAIKAYTSYLKIYPEGQYSKIVTEKLKALNVYKKPHILNPLELTKNFKLKENEYLKYDVSYAINVGSLTIDAAGEKNNYDGREVLKVDYRLKSTTFLITLDAYFEAYLNTENLNTEISYFSQDLGEKINEKKVYIFDRKARLFRCRTVRAGGKLEYIERELPVNTQDGTALLYYTRGLVASKINEQVTTIIDEKFKRTDILNSKQLEEEEVFNKNNTFHYINAKAHYQGIAGMTGAAEGYFSKHDFVPVLGKMKIIVGKVRVELVEQR